MSDFMEFGSIEEAFQWMADRTDEANEHLHQRQRDLTWGSNWVRFYNIPDRIIIFGHVLTREEAEEGEHRGIEQIADPVERQEAIEEAVWSINRMIENHERGYLFGRAYSILEPDGEFGDTHRADAWPITPALFEHARSKAWRIDDFDAWAKGELEQVNIAYQTHRMKEFG